MRMRRRAAAPPSPPEEPLRLSPAVLPPKKRRRTPRSAKPPVPVVAPPPAAALAVRRNQISAPPAASRAADADNHLLLVLANAAVSQADAEAEKEAAFPPAPAPPPPPAGSSASSLLPATAAAHEDKSLPQLPPLAAVDGNPSSFSFSIGRHGDAAAAAKGTARGDRKEAACPHPPQGNAGSSSSKGDHDQRGGIVVFPAAGGALAPPLPLPLPQPGGGDEELELELGEIIPGDDDEDLELGEIPPEKPAAGRRNADSAAHASSSSPAKEGIMTEGEEEANMTIAAGEPAATGSSARRAVATAAVASKGVMGRYDEEAAAKMAAAEEKRMREVFVGGLSSDARVHDVRAALSPAGEITEVRMIRSKTNRKNMGYCFVAFRDAAMASKAVAEFNNVKICGMPCRVAVPEGNEKTNKIAQRDPITDKDYNRMYEQRQAVHSSYITSWDPHAWYENNTYAIPASSYVASPVGYYIPMYRYHNGNRVYLPPPDLNRGQAGQSGRSQMGQSGSSRPAGQPHRSRN